MKWNPGWAWLGLLLLVTGYVVVFDVHALVTRTETMTGRMRDWIFDPVIGPFIIGFWIALFGGLMWHFLVRTPVPR